MIQTLATDRLTPAAVSASKAAGGQTVGRYGPRFAAGLGGSGQEPAFHGHKRGVTDRNPGRSA